MERNLRADALGSGSCSTCERRMSHLDTAHTGRWCFCMCHLLMSPVDTLFVLQFLQYMHHFWLFVTKGMPEIPSRPYNNIKKTIRQPPVTNYLVTVGRENFKMQSRNQWVMSQWLHPPFLHSNPRSTAHGGYIFKQWHKWIKACQFYTIFNIK